MEVKNMESKKSMRTWTLGEALELALETPNTKIRPSFHRNKVIPLWAFVGKGGLFVYGTGETYRVNPDDVLEQWEVEKPAGPIEYFDTPQAIVLCKKFLKVKRRHWQGYGLTRRPNSDNLCLFSLEDGTMDKEDWSPRQEDIHATDWAYVEGE